MLIVNNSLSERLRDVRSRCSALNLPFAGLLSTQIAASSTSHLPPHANRLIHESRQYSSSTSSLASRAASEAGSTISAPPLLADRHNKSRWQKLFSAFKKTKGPGGSGHGGVAASSDAYCLKHSHNCSNSFLRAGISNMKGYKKANQDRYKQFYALFI